MAAGSRKKSGAQHQGSAKRFECGVDGALVVIRRNTDAKLEVL